MDSGSTKALADLGFIAGEGVRGLLKGCARPVEMAGGGWSLGESSGRSDEERDENVREDWEKGCERRAEARRKQERQIMVAIWLQYGAGRQF